MFAVWHAASGRSFHLCDQESRLTCVDMPSCAELICTSVQRFARFGTTSFNSILLKRYVSALTMQTSMQGEGDAAQTHLRAATILLHQFPWRDIGELTHDQLSGGVLPALEGLLQVLVVQAAEGMGNSEEVAGVLFKVSNFYIGCHKSIAQLQGG